MARILLAEPGYSGHVFVYLALLARHAVEAGHEVVCLISSAGQHSTEYDRHLKVVHGISVEVVPSPVLLEDVARASVSMQSNLVVIPNGDVYVTAVARGSWAGQGALRLLVMRDPRWESPTKVTRRLRSVSYTHLTLPTSDLV